MLFQKHVALLLEDNEINSQDPLPQEYLEPVKALWNDGGVKQAIEKGNEYALHDNLT